MPCMSTSAYQKQVDSILEVVEDYTKEELTQAGQRLRNIVLDENPDLDKDDTLDVAVSFDGTWAKRGFTSLTGVVFAISVDSGEVLDYTVLSKACQKCSLKQSQCEGDDERFQEWRREHLASGECDINFNGSSPAMEAEGASILWRRSIELHNMRYKWMVSDGDSKAFNTVENVYDDCKVIKLDCVGHEQKRMGKHLINGTVWVRCPKHKHHGAKVVRYAAASAICHFHKGAECRNEIMDKLSIPGGSHTTHSFRLKNNKRLRKANAQATAMEKKRRQGLQLVRTRREEALLEIDGPSYDPGGF